MDEKEYGPECVVARSPWLYGRYFASREDAETYALWMAGFFEGRYDSARQSQSMAQGAERARGRQERVAKIKAGGYPLPEDWSPRGDLP